MKKNILAIILMIVFVLSFASCKNETGGTFTNESTDNVQSTQGVSDKTVTQSNTPALGEQESNNAQKQIYKDTSLYVNKDTNLSLPVIIDSYPLGHGGAEYTVDDNIRFSLESNAKKYLELIGEEYDADNWEFDEKAGALKEKPAIDGSLYLMPEYISFAFHDGNINVDMTEEEIEEMFSENLYLSAMVDFVGIDEPVLSIDISEQYGKKYVEAKVFNDSDNISEKIVNSQFNFVEIRMSEDSSQYHFNCRFVDTSKKVSMPDPALTYSDALTSKSIKTDSSYKGCEIIYERDTVNGLYIPCYVFYNDKGAEKSGENDLTVATIVPIYIVDETAE